MTTTKNIIFSLGCWQPFRIFFQQKLNKYDNAHSLGLIFPRVNKYGNTIGDGGQWKESSLLPVVFIYVPKKNTTDYTSIGKQIDHIGICKLFRDRASVTVNFVSPGLKMVYETTK